MTKDKPYHIHNGKYLYWNQDTKTWGPKNRATPYSKDQMENMVLEPGTLWAKDKMPSRANKGRTMMRYVLMYHGEVYGYYSTHSVTEVSRSIREAIEFHGMSKNAYDGMGMRDRLHTMARTGCEGMDFSLRGLRLLGLTEEQFKNREKELT